MAELEIRVASVGARVDTLIRGADWAEAGTNGHDTLDSLPAELTLRTREPLS